MVQGRIPADITIKMRDPPRQGLVLKFGRVEAENAYVWQPIEFTKAEKGFQKNPDTGGDYTLKIELRTTTIRATGQGRGRYPFKITE